MINIIAYWAIDLNYYPSKCDLQSNCLMLLYIIILDIF